GLMKGNNKILLNNLVLGDRVESPDALNLPLDLALALLKDSSGKIDVSLPVEGNTNDPEFRLGGVITKALVNLITKVVAAPFNFLASLVGADANDFDRILFSPGKAALAPPEREKVDQLALALEQ